MSSESKNSKFPNQPPQTQKPGGKSSSRAFLDVQDLQKRVADLVNQSPDKAAKILADWLQQPASRRSLSAHTQNQIKKKSA